MSMHFKTPTPLQGYTSLTAGFWSLCVLARSPEASETGDPAFA